MKNLYTYLSSKTFDNYCKKRNIEVIFSNEDISNEDKENGLAARVSFHIYDIEKYFGVFTEDDSMKFDLYKGKYNGHYILKYNSSYQFPDLNNIDLEEVDDFNEIKEIVECFKLLRKQAISDDRRSKGSSY